MKVTILDGGSTVEVPSKSRPGLVHSVKPFQPHCPCERYYYRKGCDHLRTARAALMKAGYIEGRKSA